MGKLGFLKRNQNVDTWTAINTNGICIIEQEKAVRLFYHINCHKIFDEGPVVQNERHRQLTIC